jgi:hypothetical protein
MKCLPWALALFLSLRTLCASAEEAPALTYEKDVRPILKQHCFHCHGEEPEPKGKLDLRTVKVMLKGGDSGAAIAPGAPSDSLLWKRVEADEMPEGHKKVPANQKATLKAWLEQGAKTARPEPDNPSDARFTEEELSHWAWQIPVKAPVPTTPENFANPIDAFLLTKLRSQGIENFSTTADRRTLIRRASFDLTGLPPTPQEVEDFVSDAAPQAYEKLLERLLHSPRYGERWARHWLDVAGYAETDDPSADTIRPHAWRYRDYVIASFNAHKPYDQFLREQLAGDELTPKPYKLDDSQVLDSLVATGFLQMAPDATQTANALTDRNDAVAEMIKIVSSATLGLTVGCAQCHDHKYDPISAEDYYRLRAIFDPAFDLQAWKQPSGRLLDVTPKEVLDEAAKIEAEVKKKDEEVSKAHDDFAKIVFDREVARLPEAERAPAIAAVQKAEKDRTPEEKTLLDKYPQVKPLSFIRGFFVEYDKEIHAKLTAMIAEVAKLRGTIPPRQFLMVTQDIENPPVSKVHFRGNPAQPTREVTPGEVSVIARATAPEITPSGRRAAYAQWLTSPKHPLTARVFVNRIWQHHFGKGLVGTASDFGLNGERPSHPELLDWLAVDFMEHGWNIERLHKQIMTSLAYQQSSQRTPKLDELDPDNRLLGRQSLRRLDAESLRDAILTVSGKINFELGGPSVPVVENEEGIAVFGKRQKREGLLAGVDSVGDDAFRRSIYIQQRRALPLALLETFDLPKMTPNCDSRRNSTVAPQSLLLLNDEFLVQQAGFLSERLLKEAENTSARIDLAFELLFAGAPTDAERSACQQFVTTQTEHFKTHGDKAWLDNVAKNPEAAEARALASLCQTLLCGNRFLYID